MNRTASTLACARTVRRTVSRLARQLRPNLRRDGISVAKLSVIAHIKRVGSVTPSALAAHEGVKIQSLTRLLAELEADGWLMRELDSEDRRQSKLSLTPIGQQRLTGAAREKDVRLAKIMEDVMSVQERDILVKACVLMDGLSDAFGVAGERAANLVTEPKAPSGARARN